ncbi:PREDICTED: uncharacterized protein LOC109228110 [Nicotiana attenuata]|uniref:uncharacterized protein LOC109228110 n=1 Tax=Nicotiana attenuata TaxID=49451 RepID=UPI000904CAEF|nr:PREDICTED: uncharacterized protein LOC109228110 [Nicotiana attenuata]
MSDVPKYDRTSDSQEHITTYTIEGALTWYLLLLEHSVDAFEMLADSFIKAHAGARKDQARKADIFSIAQQESKLLREFITRFQKERMLLPVIPDKWVTEIRIEDDHLGFLALIKGRDRDKNWEKFKDDFDVDGRSSKSRCLPYEKADRRENKGFFSPDRFAPERRTDRGRNNRSLQDKEVSGIQDSTYPRLSNYNFNISIVELVSTIRNINEARFLKPIRFDPSQRDRNLCCEYHGTHGHRTWDCRHLREEVATLLKNGHLRQFLCDRAENN